MGQFKARYNFPIVNLSYGFWFQVFIFIVMSRAASNNVSVS